MTRLPARDGERIDRSSELAFRFEGRPVRGFAGDTIGSALYASGRRVFSRSFKYHRPRGLLCCTGACANCMMTVDGVPNVRVCVEPLRADADVRAQNVVGSLEHDLLAVVDQRRRAVHAGRLLLPDDDPSSPRVAGVRTAAARSRRPRTRRRGDAPAVRRRAPARRGARDRRRAVRTPSGGDAAADGRDVVLVDERRPFDAAGAYEVLAPARAIGIYEGGLVPVDAGDVLHRFRAGRSSSRPARSSSLWSSRGTTSSASCCRPRSGASSTTGPYARDAGGGRGR